MIQFVCTVCDYRECTVKIKKGAVDTFSPLTCPYGTDWCQSPDWKEIKTAELPEDIDKVYSTYPSRCPVHNSSTGKTAKNKDRIKKLLWEGRTVEGLTELIQKYVSNCITYKRYVKNFGTFLNNLPEPESLGGAPMDERATRDIQHIVNRLNDGDRIYGMDYNLLPEDVKQQVIEDGGRFRRADDVKKIYLKEAL